MNERIGTMTELPRFETKQQAAARRIMEEAFPTLLEMRAAMLADGRMPKRVILPAHLDPGTYDGPDADPNQPAMLMGLPVTWGDEIGLSD